MASEIQMIKIIKAVQVLKDEGWLFVDEGTDCFKIAVNTRLGEEIPFRENKHFIQWILAKSL